MYESNASTLVTGVGSATAGVALLPNTSGSVLLTTLGIATIVLGVLAIISFIAGRIAKNVA